MHILDQSELILCNRFSRICKSYRPAVCIDYKIDFSAACYVVIRKDTIIARDVSEITLWPLIFKIYLNFIGFVKLSISHKEEPIYL